MEKIIEVILKYVEPEGELTAESNLKKDCGLTSFDTTCMVNELCELYGVDIKTVDIRSLRTIGDLCEVLAAAR